MLDQMRVMGKATQQVISAIELKMGIFNDQYMKRTGIFGVMIKNIQSAAMDLAWLDS